MDSDELLVIDCDRCTVRGLACADCVVGVMLGPPPGALDADEQRAIDVLARHGLVPGLQMHLDHTAERAG